MPAGSRNQVQALYQFERGSGGPLPRAVVPRISLESPKIARKLTTEWFANRVAERYKRCLLRHAPEGR